MDESIRPPRAPRRHQADVDEARRQHNTTKRELQAARAQLRALKLDHREAVAALAEIRDRCGQPLVDPEAAVARSHHVARRALERLGGQSA